MRKSAKIIAALSVAGLTVAAGSAFTAGNTMPAADIKGYGQVTSTGVEVASMTFITVVGDASKLDKVTFTTNTADTTGKSVSMTLKNDTELVTSVVCGSSFETPTSTITCDLTTDLLLSSFDTTGLTVL